MRRFYSIVIIAVSLLIASLKLVFPFNPSCWHMQRDQLENQIRNLSPSERKVYEGEIREWRKQANDTLNRGDELNAQFRRTLDQETQIPDTLQKQKEELKKKLEENHGKWGTVDFRNEDAVRRLKRETDDLYRAQGEVQRKEILSKLPNAKIDEAYARQIDYQAKKDYEEARFGADRLLKLGVSGERKPPGPSSGSPDPQSEVLQVVKELARSGSTPNLYRVARAEALGREITVEVGIDPREMTGEINVKNFASIMMVGNLEREHMSIVGADVVDVRTALGPKAAQAISSSSAKAALVTDQGKWAQTKVREIIGDIEGPVSPSPSPPKPDSVKETLSKATKEVGKRLIRLPPKVEDKATPGGTSHSPE